MFKVIVQFKDLQDKNHLYKVGDTYPRKGSTPSMDRIGELASKANRRRTALIRKVEEPKAKASVEEPKAEEKTPAEKPKKATTSKKSTSTKAKK